MGLQEEVFLARETPARPGEVNLPEGLQGGLLWRKLGGGRWFRRKRRGWPRPAAGRLLSDTQDSRELTCMLKGSVI